MHASKWHDKKSQRRQKTTRLHQLKRRSVSLVRSGRVKRSRARVRQPPPGRPTGWLPSRISVAPRYFLLHPLYPVLRSPARTPALFQSIVLSLYKLICGTAGCLYAVAHFTRSLRLIRRRCPGFGVLRWETRCVGVDRMTSGIIRFQGDNDFRGFIGLHLRVCIRLNSN